MLPLACTDVIRDSALTKEALTAAASQGRSLQELQAGHDRKMFFQSSGQVF